jgi:hypothetical protein
MARKSYMAENRELAYKTWRKFNQNIDRCAKELRRMPGGFPVTRATLTRWRDEDGWEERAAKMDALAQETKDVQSSALERALVALTKQQAKYETWFEAQEATVIDAQVQHAYNNLVQLIVRIDKQMKEKPDLYLMTPVVMEAFVKFVKQSVKEQDAQDRVFALVDRFMEEVKPADAL